VNGGKWNRCRRESDWRDSLSAQAWGEFKTFLEDGRKQLGANFVVQVR
jgi:hypothetical protein